MSSVWNLTQIERALDSVDVLSAMERAFVAYSSGRAVVPPVGELLFDSPPGDAHIKYGYIQGDKSFVIKVATGFYENERQGLPANSGLMLVFSARTGLLEAVLLDEGHLTNVRTAAAGAVAAKHLARSNIQGIGICGTGVQARMQLEYLKHVTSCREVWVWGRRPERAEAYALDMMKKGFKVEVARTPAALAGECDLIVTATVATQPLLLLGDIRPGTHITAMGSDTASKNELDPELLVAADLYVMDSVRQCSERGELHHAIRAGALGGTGGIELGDIIAGKIRGRRDPQQITICDLTGVAVQDIEISKAVLEGLGTTAGQSER